MYNRKPLPALTEDSVSFQRDLFINLSTRISQLAAMIDVKVIPYRDPELPYFTRLTKQQREIVLSDLQNYLDICEMTIKGGSNLRDLGQMVWNTLRKFELRPTSDLFQFVPQGNVIEIHNREHKQIFRSFSFYECCSYSLEELHSFSWTHLYTRDLKVESYLVNAAMTMFKGDFHRTIPLELGPHSTRELYSLMGFEIEAQMKFLSPLFGNDSGQIEAHILIEDGRVVNTHPTLSDVIPFDFGI